ncbi:GntR family transcriptional regulator [Oceaniglobus indicus]|uniref:GntR family transcriptional regulator n=1 Tax=Oceaniglobus indicus TaxID=2047749 RepID=UPI0019D4D01A|nr:GntR family transcriptional regulator [Oceaniglobus indicus]
MSETLVFLYPSRKTLYELFEDATMAWEDSSRPILDPPIGAQHPGLGSLTLDVDRRLSVSDQVHAVLRQAIVDVRLAPNERISENSICRQFSVSRTPVRTAIQRLVEEGLVDVSPQRGSYVAPLRLDGLRDSHFVRRSLELALLRETATLWTPEMGVALRDVIADQARTIETRDPDEFLRADERFHQMLAGYSGRHGVWPAIQTAQTPLRRFHRYWAHENRLFDVLDEHRAVIDALDRGDAAAAHDALARHLDMVFVIFDRMSDEQQAKLPFDVPLRGPS